MDLVSSVPALAEVIRRLHPNFSPPVLLVGGAVRDILTGEDPTDFDLVVEESPERVAMCLNGDVQPYGRFGTATVRIDGFTYDIAQARRETYAHPGALPDVEPAPLQDDLLRRDFTVNAIAVALTGDAPGRTEAAPHALEDLAARRLRVLHAASFLDDPTRLLRLIRYQARLAYTIEDETLRLARRAIADSALQTVSGPRIGNELRLIAREHDPIAPLRGLRELDLDQAIDAELGLTEPRLASEALDHLPADGRRDLLALAVFARAVSSRRLTPLLDRLGFAAPDRDTIIEIVSRAPELAAALRKARRPSEIAEAVGPGGAELVALAGALGPTAPAQRWLDELRHLKLAIDGSDLLAAGVPTGPAIGAGLRAAWHAALDGYAPDRDGQLAEALRVARSEG